MQKTGLFIVIFGILIAAGLGISVIENQITLEGIAQGNGKVNTEQVITISVNLDKDKTPVGIFAVQIMDFKENTFSAKIIDPLDIEIISKKIDIDTVEQEFKILNSGNYELIIQSSDWASEKFGKTTITERPIITESSKIIKVDLVIFNISKNFKIMYLNLP